jgi:murein L,D-transpeptidase YafK
MLNKPCLCGGLLAFMLGLPALGVPAAPEPTRVAQARVLRGQAVAQLLAAHQIAPDKLELFLRAFKQSGELEVWGRNAGDARFALLKTYPICAASGVLGPKRQQGDWQVPEGFYVIDRFNPYSSYHLSLGLSYPNRQDRQRAAAANIRNPGGDIFIHGNCVSVGCLAMGDAAIEEIYLLALSAKAAIHRPIAVHIFPARMDAQGFARLEKAAPNPATLTFWRELRPAYESFERTRSL